MLPSFRSYVVFWSLVAAGFLALVWLLGDVMLPFVVGVAVAYLLNPLVGRVMARGYSRPVATGGILGAFLLALVVVIALVVPVMAREIAAFAYGLPATIGKVRAFVESGLIAYQPYFAQMQGYDWLTQLGDNMGRAIGSGAGVVNGVVNGTQAVFGFFAFIALMPVVAFFMTSEWPQIIRSIDDLLPRKSAATLRDLMRQIDDKIAGFIRGQMIVCVILAVYYMVVLTAIGLKYGVLIGLMSGVLAIIPFVGSAFALVSSVLVGLWQMQESGVLILILPVVAIAIGQFVEGNFITPKVVGDRVGLHPLWIIFALLAGASVMGLLGMFLAVPVAAAISVLVSFGVAQYKNSPYYTEGVKPAPASSGKAS